MIGDWDQAPVGLLQLRPDGMIAAANRTLLDWVGRERAQVIHSVRFSQLLSIGGRIYWETHLAPLLHVEGRCDEVAVELKTSAGRVPVLLSAVVERGDDGSPTSIHVALSSAQQRSHYERELRAARACAETAATGLRALQQATAALAGAAGVHAVADALLDVVTDVVGAAGAALWLSVEGNGLHLHGSRGETSGLTPPEPAGSTPGSTLLPLGDDPGVVVDVHGQALLRAVLTLAPRREAGAEALDRQALAAIAAQAGLALDRAHLHDQSAAIARELQQSLLAAPPPLDPRYAVATVYRPAEEGLAVGGDWHDVFSIDEHTVGIVVGDVVGHGLHAASAMGQLRSAVRAVSGPGVAPDALLTRLDRYVEQVEAASMATVVYAELDLASGLLRYASAGHPPLLLVPCEGSPRLLWEGRSTPLSAFFGAHRDTHDVQLAPGDRVLLFTDGLFERRDRPLDQGLEVLADAASRVRHLSLGGAVEALTRAMLSDEQAKDDVCVLLLSWGEEVRSRSEPRSSWAPSREQSR